MEEQKYKVKVREVIEHVFEVVAVNEYMAKEEAVKTLKEQQLARVWHDKRDMFVEKVKWQDCIGGCQMKCDYKGCNESGESMCMICDIAGEVYHRCFCIAHLKKMLYDVKGVCYEEQQKITKLRQNEKM